MGPLSPNSALLFKLVLAYTGVSMVFLGLVLAFRGSLPAKKRVVGLGLALAGCALAAFPFITKTEGVGVSYYGVSSNLEMMAELQKPGDYSVSGRRIDIYLGRGSGGNTAEITSVEAINGVMIVKVDANYCGSTRNLVPLVKSIELRGVPVSAEYPVKVEIRPTCGSIPSR